MDSDFDFAAEIAAIFAKLAEQQRPLPPDFEAVWRDNVKDLYEP